MINEELYNELQKAEGSNPLHVEYITVTRNGKTYTQRYRKKTPKVETPSTLDTKNKSALIDKIYFSNYYNGEFYDSKGHKLYLSPEWKEYAKQLKVRTLQDKHTEAWIEHLQLIGDEQMTDEDKESMKKEIYKNEREKFNSEVLPNILERNKKIEEWSRKNMTRLKNNYKDIYSKEGILSSANRAVNKLNENTTYNELSTALLGIKSKIGDAVNDKIITYNFKGNIYTDTFDSFKKKVDNRINSKKVKGYDKIGANNFTLSGLYDIDESKIAGIKSWEDYYESQLEYADKNLIK